MISIISSATTLTTSCSLALQTAFSDSRCGERLRGFVVIQNNDQSSKRDTKVLLRQTIILQISFMCQQVYCKAAISILIPFKHLYPRFVFLFFTCEKKIERNVKLFRVRLLMPDKRRVLLDECVF